jgi:hypothetical protein
VPGWCQDLNDKEILWLKIKLEILLTPGASHTNADEVRNTQALFNHICLRKNNL